MTSRRPLIPAVIAAAAALAPAAASAQAPTLQWDRPCYTEHQRMNFTGAGYTPAGQVDLLFSRPGTALGSYTTTADPAGALADYVMADAGDLLPDDEDRLDIFVTGNDRTRIDQGAPPESQFSTSQFTFTRWMGFSPGRYVPGRKVKLEAYGWAFATGKPLYFVFQRHGRSVTSVKVGRLSAPCGDLIGRVRVPRKLKPGAYRLVLATTRHPTDADDYTWRKGHVTRGAKAAIATRAPMLRSPHGGGERGPW
jgi:hypothetical protein